MLENWFNNNFLPAMARSSAGSVGGEPFWDFEAFELTRDALEEFGVGVIAGLLLGLIFYDELYFLL
jgi:hypothetical protein